MTTDAIPAKIITRKSNERVGMIGTGAISHKHAQAYKNIGFQLTVCTDINETYGRKFADQYGAHHSHASLHNPALTEGDRSSDNLVRSPAQAEE